MLPFAVTQIEALFGCDWVGEPAFQSCNNADDDDDDGR